MPQVFVWGRSCHAKNELHRVMSTFVNVRSHIDWRGERNILIRVWKHLPSRCILKSWGQRRYVMSQNRQYLLVVSLSYYKWYQNQTLTLSSVSTKTLPPREIVRSHIDWSDEKAFLIRVWKPFPNRCVLKSWSWRYIMSQSGQYVLAMGLNGSSKVVWSSLSTQLRTVPDWLS